MEAQGQHKTQTQKTASPQLHVCRECHSDLVQPTDWHETTPKNWMVTLTCPNCLTERMGEYSQEIVDELDETLDAGFTTLLAELQELMASNMADEIERFAAALQADAILPEDF
ncbi:MAG: hypothetical protein QOG62_1240 [Thermoleophilaceae bacterium]|nr:hypothetical protein [Thermoleophilaceae bacterium]